MTTDDTRPLSDELGFEDRTDDRTEQVERTDAVDRPDRGEDTATAGPAVDTTRPYGDPPVYRKGPAPFGLFLAVVGLVLAGGVIVTELSDVSVPWSDLGPWVVVAGGLLVVLVGVLGLRANRGTD